jgi:hypothetical protein
MSKKNETKQTETKTSAPITEGERETEARSKVADRVARIRAELSSAPLQEALDQAAVSNKQRSLRVERAFLAQTVEVALAKRRALTMATVEALKSDPEWIAATREIRTLTAEPKPEKPANGANGASAGEVKSEQTAQA